MYVRSGKERDQTWVSDLFRDFGFEITTFCPEEFVVAVDETTTTRLGAGRIMLHERQARGTVCELTALAVAPNVQQQGVGAHLTERALAKATDAGVDRVYVVTTQPQYFTQFGFHAVEQSEIPASLPAPEPDAIVLRITPDRFRMPDRLRTRFKQLRAEPAEPATQTTAEDFEINSEDATYKYEP